MSVRAINRFFSQANDRIATKLAHDGPQVSLHPGCAQGQGQGQLSAGYCHFGWLLSRVARHHFVRVDSVPSRKLGPARTRPRVARPYGLRYIVTKFRNPTDVALPEVFFTSAVAYSRDVRPSVRPSVRSSVTLWYCQNDLNEQSLASQSQVK